MFFDYEDNNTHLESLLYPFIPSFMRETEECSFLIESNEPIQLDKFIATLENKGFKYDKSQCIFNHLNGSNGASAILENVIKITPKFAVLAIKGLPFERCNTPYNLTAIIIDPAKDFFKNRKQQEVFLKTALKKFRTQDSGRKCTQSIPQMALIQIIYFPH